MDESKSVLITNRKVILVTVPSKPHRNIGIMVFASLVNACCGVILAFDIPKFLSVDDFGNWRTFLLYAYPHAGLLHLGVVDGALIVWSKDRSGSPARSILGRTFRFVALEHLLIIAAAASFLLHAPPPIPVLLDPGGFALLFNLVALVQIYHQTGFRLAPWRSA